MPVAPAATVASAGGRVGGGHGRRVPAVVAPAPIRHHEHQLVGTGAVASTAAGAVTGVEAEPDPLEEGPAAHVVDVEHRDHARAPVHRSAPGRTRRRARPRSRPCAKPRPWNPGTSVIPTSTEGARGLRPVQVEVADERPAGRSRGWRAGRAAPGASGSEPRSASMNRRAAAGDSGDGQPWYSALPGSEWDADRADASSGHQPVDQHPGGRRWDGTAPGQGLTRPCRPRDPWSRRAVTVPRWPAVGRGATLAPWSCSRSAAPTARPSATVCSASRPTRVSSLAYVAAAAYVLRRGGPPGPGAGAGPGGRRQRALPRADAPGCGAGARRRAGRGARGGARRSPWRRRSFPRPPALAVVALGLGAVANVLSRTGAPLCRPDSLLQGHALWHVLTAVGAALWLACWPDPGARRSPVSVRRTGNPAAQV